MRSKRKNIPVRAEMERWRNGRTANKLGEDFGIIEAMIKARIEFGLTQEQVAKRLKTKQSAVARLENGSALPSTRTLKRYAAATGHRLMISFEPVARRRKAG